MLLSELYTPKQVLHYICPIAISLATDRVADVRIIAFKLVSTNNHSSIRATITVSHQAMCDRKFIYVQHQDDCYYIITAFFRFNCTTREKMYMYIFFVIL